MQCTLTDDVNLFFIRTINERFNSFKTLVNYTDVSKLVATYSKTENRTKIILNKIIKKKKLKIITAVNIGIFLFQLLKFNMYLCILSNILYVTMYLCSLWDV